MKCPTCRRRELGDSEACPRCGTDLRELLALENEFTSALQHGRVLLRLRQPDAARRMFRRALDIHSADVEALRGLALAELCRDSFRSALLYWLQTRARDH